MVSGVIHDSRHDGKSWRPFHDPSIRNQLKEDLIRGLTHDRPGVDEGPIQPPGRLLK